jgi:peptidoglycan/LPS O-acetylase OafA/YrhL
MDAAGQVIGVSKAGQEKSNLMRVLTRFGGLFQGGPRELVAVTEKRIPFLDALRSLAVLLVINQHSSMEFAKRYGANLYTRFPLTANGWIGVDLFFVLSGYFIGSQLWKELVGSGTISIGRFMARRGLRIWPLYFFIFAAVAILVPGAAAAKQYGWTDIVFITNYVNHGIVMGSWSLCSEEQFYLLTPALLLLIGRRSMRTYRWGLAGLLVLVSVVRAITYIKLTGHLWGRHPNAFAALYYPFHTHCDGLISGLIVANLVVSRDKVKGLFARPPLLAALSAILLILLVVFHSEAEQFAGLGIFFASLVWWGIHSGTKRFGQHIFYLVSRLSFGMYLNHEYMQAWIIGRVLPILGVMRLGSSAASVVAFMLLTVCSVALSVVTFCLIEHPFLMVRTAVLRKKIRSPLITSEASTPTLV